MGFTRSTDNMSIIQGLSDLPNTDDGLSAQELKAKFDLGAETLQGDLNNLIEELEDENSSASLGANAIDESDTTDGNIQSKLEELATRTNNLKAGGLVDGAIITSKIADSNVTAVKLANNSVVASKIADGNITTTKIADANVTTNKLVDGAVTQAKIEATTKEYMLNATNHTAVAFSSDDISNNNVQAKLTKLYNDMQGITQGGVADGAITTAKLADFSVTPNKIENSSITESKIIDGYGLLPKGLICMWSGSVIPTGWYLCNGQNGTPDLRNKFIVGTGDEYSIGNTGGEKQHTLNTNEMPSHSHKFYYHDSGTNSFADGNCIGAERAGQWEYTYTRQNITTQAIGGGQPHENRPPYYALAFIMKA